MKKILILLLLTLSVSISAQKWDGFFKPVPKFSTDRVGSSEWLFRPSAAITATVFTLSYNDAGEFTGFNAGFLAKTGVGISYAHFVPDSEGNAVNNYSFNGMLMLPTDGATNAALAVTASIFKINAGVGYNLVKGAFKENLFFLTGVQLTF